MAGGRAWPGGGRGYWPDAESGGEGGAMGGGGQQPVIIHHHHNSTTNIDTHYGESPGPDENRGAMAADLVGGTGVWN